MAAEAVVVDGRPRAVAPAAMRGRTSTRLLALFAAAIGLGVVVVLSLALGARDVPVATAWDSFTAYDETVRDQLIVRSLRVPRTLIGLAVGAALAVAGALMQGTTRNPLADPGILGVNAGASVGVVLAIFVLGVTSPAGWVGFAMAGAFAAAVVVYTLGSRGRGGATPVKLALAGAATTAMLFAVTDAVVLLDQMTLDAYRFWLVGSLSGRDLAVLGAVAPAMLLGGIVSLGVAPSMDAMSLGDDVATALGQRVGVTRAVVAAAVVLLVGSAVAVAGPITFVGLVVPHVARAITGPSHRWLLPMSALLGPVLLLGADVIGRLVVRPGELQVGIVTAVVGAPLFIALVRRRTLAEL